MENAKLLSALRSLKPLPGKSLDGYVEINAIVADELWKESIEVPERSLKLVYQGSFKNGKVSSQVPLHGKHDFSLRLFTLLFIEY